MVLHSVVCFEHYVRRTSYSPGPGHVKRWASRYIYLIHLQRVLTRPTFASPVDTMARFSAILATLSCATQAVIGMWPMPHTLTDGTSSLKLARKFSIELALSDVPQDLLAAVADVKSHLKTDAFERLVVGRGTTDAIPVSQAAELPSLRLSLAPQAQQVRSIATEATVPLDERSEAYELIIPHDGSQATLAANSSLGLFRGLTTFEQLWYNYKSEKYILNAPLKIIDGPAFVCDACSTNFRTKLQTFDSHIAASHWIHREICTIIPILMRASQSRLL